MSHDAVISVVSGVSWNKIKVRTWYQLFPKIRKAFLGTMRG